MTIRGFTQQQFVDEMQAAGFIGAWKFWKEFVALANDNGHYVPEELIRDARMLLANMGKLSVPLGRGWSTQEREAYNDIGIKE